MTTRKTGSSLQLLGKITGTKAGTKQKKMNFINGLIWLYMCVWMVHGKVTQKDELKWNKGYSLPNLLEVTDQQKNFHNGLWVTK